MQNASPIGYCDAPDPMTELQSLPLFHQISRQKVLVLGDGDTAEPKRRLVERAGGIVVDDARLAIDDGVRIAFVALDDPKACEVAAANLRGAGMLVNVVDRPDLCDFTTPSILDRNPVLIAVGTGGASAGLAKHIRLRLEHVLPQSLGRLAQNLFAARPKLRETYPEGSARRSALDGALRESGTLDVFEPGSHGRVADWLKTGDPAPKPRVAAFTLTSGDPEDLTLKQARLLGEADVVCAAAEVPPEILGRARADARRLICGGECAITQSELAADSQPQCRNLAQADPDADQSSGLTVILRWCP